MLAAITGKGRSMDLKEAVAVARHCIEDLFAADPPRDIRLEGFLYDDHLIWALAVLGKRQRCVRMHEAGPYQRLKRTEPIAPVSTAAR